ncbi:hypothetical protein PybrP1_008762 [[Pythium] brassicae (nom. inval.)]|nr:hypothetical protein PybrP1_008762 [[Pythium] brassicae (nom. inval.)]
MPVSPAAPPQQRPPAVLGICGGVGPAAGVLLHQTLLEHTAGDGRDQCHLSVCHLSRSDDMTDRSEFLLQHSTATDRVAGADGGASSEDGRERVENPAWGMARTFAMMQAALAAATSSSCESARLVLGVPCNTFHAKPIWDEFLRLTAPTPSPSPSVRHVHMLEETVRFIAQYAPASTRIGLMATTGTRQSRVYHDLLEPRGYRIVEVPPLLQAELHESIYNSAWGIKSTAPAVTPRCVANFHRYARQLKESGAEVIVMGCTEIPFAFAGRKAVAGVLLIDPLVALARAMIREADPSRLKHLELQAAAAAASSVAPVNKLLRPQTPTKNLKSCWSPR